MEFMFNWFSLSLLLCSCNALGVRPFISPDLYDTADTNGNFMFLFLFLLILFILLPFQLFNWLSVLTNMSVNIYARLARSEIFFFFFCAKLQNYIIYAQIPCSYANYKLSNLWRVVKLKNSVLHTKTRYVYIIAWEIQVVNIYIEKPFC